MNAPILFIRSHHAEPQYDPFCSEGERGDFVAYVESGALRAVWEWELTPADLAGASGLITTIGLDQIRMMDFTGNLAAFLARGGRWLFNGHVARPLVSGLEPFRPALGHGIARFVQTVLADHPVFAGIDRSIFQSVRGVAGFYGRGCNPMPEGATALTGVGPDILPIDWHWRVPGGGEILVHAGNDWWGTSTDKPAMNRFVGNLVAWVGGKEA
jgi:hypothetical protein